MGNPYSNVKTFAKATVDEARAAIRGDEPVPAAEVSRRLGLCRSCQNLDSGICRVCSCIVEIKARYRTQSCPQGRW